MIRLSTAGRRGAFTLIELLVVIAIIGILVGLTTAAVMVFFKKGPETQNMVEIRQLSTSATNFKELWAKFYPPSKIRLCRFRGDYGTSNYEIESLNYINGLWSDIDNAAWANSGINWDNGLDPNHKVWDLEGDQCLVFFLGGIPGGTDRVLGFSTSKTNPVQTTGDRKRFFDFQSDRLYVRALPDPITGQPNSTYPFLSYYDVYRTQPYAYFSSGRGANRYQLSHYIAGLGIGPYWETPQRFLNPDTFQIISAGGDGKFGGNSQGQQWTLTTADTVFDDQKDNQTNFHPHMLGVSGN
jgi:prepilin-type N-terminal cleavage/methylation domain-containing protein